VTLSNPPIMMATTRECCHSHSKSAMVRERALESLYKTRPD